MQCNVESLPSMCLCTESFEMMYEMRCGQIDSLDWLAGRLSLIPSYFVIGGIWGHT